METQVKMCWLSFFNFWNLCWSRVDLQCCVRTSSLMNFYVCFDFYSKMESHGKNDKHLTYSLFIYLIFIKVQLLYNAVLVSAVQQSESAICIHVSPLFWFPSHSVTTENWVEFPLVSIHLFSVAVSLFLICKKYHLSHFSKFPIYILKFHPFSMLKRDYKEKNRAMKTSSEFWL